MIFRALPQNNIVTVPLMFKVFQWSPIEIYSTAWNGLFYTDFIITGGISKLVEMRSSTQACVCSPIPLLKCEPVSLQVHLNLNWNLYSLITPTGMSCHIQVHLTNLRNVLTNRHVVFFFKISLNELTKRALLRDPFISMYADFKTAIKNCVWGINMINTCL